MSGAEGPRVPAGRLPGFGLCLPGRARPDGDPDNRKSLKEQAVAEDLEHNNRKQP